MQSRAFSIQVRLTSSELQEDCFCFLFFKFFFFFLFFFLFLFLFLCLLFSPAFFAFFFSTFLARRLGFFPVFLSATSAVLLSLTIISSLLVKWLKLLSASPSLTAVISLARTPEREIAETRTRKRRRTQILAMVTPGRNSPC